VARRRPALVALGAGLLLVAVARLVLPDAPPLYDGVVPLEPYVWLDPPAGHPGGAKGAAADIPVDGGASPLVAVATPELEPQAQIFAQPGGLTLPKGTRTIKVSIEPVHAQGVPTDGHIDGNVYRISVTNEKGTPITAPVSARVSVVLRASDPAQFEASIARFSSGTWQPLKTSPAGFGGTYLAVATEFGEFAVIAPGPGPSVSSSTTSSAVEATPTPGGSAPSPAESPGAQSLSSSGGDASSLPIWLLAAIAAVVAGLAFGAYRIASRPRRNGYRGAHRNRRR
jgi:hypothetical protein